MSRNYSKVTTRSSGLDVKVEIRFPLSYNYKDLYNYRYDQDGDLPGLPEQ